MNSVNLMGRLTADPELKSTQTGIEVCSFTIAINRQVAKDKEKVADFIPCTAWGKTGVFANTYFHKGDMIAVEGSLQSRKYADKEGKNHTAYDVRVDKIHFCGGKKQDSADSSAYSAPSYSAPTSSGMQPLDENDELPF